MKNENEFDEKLMKGLNLAYQRMLEFKCYKKSKVILSRDGKIMEFDPIDLLNEHKQISAIK